MRGIKALILSMKGMRGEEEEWFEYQPPGCLNTLELFLIKFQINFSWQGQNVSYLYRSILYNMNFFLLLSSPDDGMFIFRKLDDIYLNIFSLFRIWLYHCYLCPTYCDSQTRSVRNDYLHMRKKYMLTVERWTVGT